MLPLPLSVFTVQCKMFLTSFKINPFFALSSLICSIFDVRERKKLNPFFFFHFRSLIFPLLLVLPCLKSLINIIFLSVLKILAIEYQITEQRTEIRKKANNKIKLTQFFSSTFLFVKRSFTLTKKLAI